MSSLLRRLPAVWVVVQRPASGRRSGHANGRADRKARGLETAAATEAFLLGLDKTLRLVDGHLDARRELHPPPPAGGRVVGLLDEVVQPARATGPAPIDRNVRTLRIVSEVGPLLVAVVERGTTASAHGAHCAGCPAPVGPVNAMEGDRVDPPRGCMQGARAQQGWCLASAGNAADGPLVGQPEGNLIAARPSALRSLCVCIHARRRAP